MELGNATITTAKFLNFRPIDYSSCFSNGDGDLILVSFKKSRVPVFLDGTVALLTGKHIKSGALMLAKVIGY
jgi:hypothetical protein